IALLAALLLPALQKAKDKAKTARCSANLHQLDVGLMMYVDDSGGVIPTAYPRCPAWYCPGSPVPNPYISTWLATLKELNYCPSLDVMHCPSDLVWTKGLYHGAYSFGYLPNYNTCSYGYNYLGLGVFGSPALDAPGDYGPFERMT